MNTGRLLALAGMVGCCAGLIGDVGVGAPGAAAPIVPPTRPATTFERVGYLLTGGIGDRHDEVVLYADGRVETPDSPARLILRKLKAKNGRSEQDEPAEKTDKKRKDEKELPTEKEKADEPRPPVQLNHYLLQEDLDKLSELMKQVNWPQIRPVYASRTTTPDGFAEKISAVIAGERFETVITDPDANPPTAFQSLVAYLKELQGTYGVYGQPDRTSPGNFTRLRWIYKTASESEEYSTSIEIANDVTFSAWQRRKRTVWGLWTEEKVIRSLQGRLGQQEFSKLQKLAEGVAWDKLGDGRDARSLGDANTHSLWLDVGKKTYYLMCSETKTPATIKPLFEHLEAIEKAHRADAQ